MTNAAAPAHTHIKAKLLAALRNVPQGRVVTHDTLAVLLASSPRLIETTLAQLSEDEREMVPWHRAVAKGGAIGRGPNRDQQFAKLIREGVAVSPAGIVQDMARTAVKDLTVTPSAVTKRPDAALPPTLGPLSRSRGMKDRPG
jgi:methylated-DNA-protein-cysteine methyltransferase related protein